MFKAVSGRRAMHAMSCAAITTMLLASCGGGGGSAPTDSTQAGMTAAETSADAQSATTTLTAESKPLTSPANSNSTETSTTTSTSTPTTTTSSTASAPFGQDASQYTLTFSDEFESGYNTSVWNDAMWYETPNATKNY